MKTETYIRRRKKLIKFIKELPKAKLDMRNYVHTACYDNKDELCGTVCCIQGWLPAVFPKSFSWLDSGGTVLVELSANGYDVNGSSNMSRFFKMGITSWENITMPEGFRIMKKPEALKNMIEVFNRNKLANETYR